MRLCIARRATKWIAVCLQPLTKDADFRAEGCFNSIANRRKLVNPQPLSDTELERMHEILERFGDKRRMNLEQLDGFLAAMLCGPYEVPQSEYVTEIWGDNIADWEAFTVHGMLQDFVIFNNPTSRCHSPYAAVRRCLHTTVTPRSTGCCSWE